jgi:hypothetical protein
MMETRSGIDFRFFHSSCENREAWGIAMGVVNPTLVGRDSPSTSKGLELFSS